MFRGSIPALVTPFRDESIDEEQFRELVEWQIAEGSSALVPCGTTGESPTLSHAEHKTVIAVTVETAAGRVPVIAGTGSNSTDEAIELCRSYAEILGGTPVFKGTRVPVQTLLDYVKNGDSIDDFLKDFPTVKKRQVIELLDAINTKLVRSVA